MNFQWFHNKGQGESRLDEQELEKFAELLREKAMPALTAPKRSRIRSHMFERIEALEMAKVQQELPLEVMQPALKPVLQEGDDEENESSLPGLSTESYLIDRLISWIRSTSSAIRLTSVKKTTIREHLYELPEPDRRSLIEKLLSSLAFRRTVAGFSLTGVFILAVFAYALKVPVTFARELTVMQDVEGSVTVVRDGREMAAMKGFELEEGDAVRTGENGKAVVTYFDKSITRFFENTDVSFESLRSENFGFDHLVSLNLDRGRVWSNIMDYVTNSEFTVKANDLVASASQRATFLVSAEKDEASLQVFHNVVSATSTTRVSEEMMIVKGYEVVAKTDVAQQVVKPITLKEEDRRWVAANIVSDQQLLGEVEKEKSGVVTGPLSKLQENASLFLAFNEDERFRLELSIAEKNFYELFKRAGVTVDEVRVAFEVLQSVVDRAAGLKSEEAKKLAGAVILSARSELLAAKPDSNLYDLKITLEDKDFAGAADDKKLVVALSQASQFLAEAQDLQVNGEAEVARKAVAKYQDRVKEADQLFARYASQRVVVAPELVEKRAALEKLYVAFRTPAPVALPIVVVPVIVVTPPVVETPRATTGLGTSVPATIAEEVTAPIEEEAPQLPPKLQLSRD